MGDHRRGVGRGILRDMVANLFEAEAARGVMMTR
jgi:hypothetical protein